jgi:signal transduction histidine kinase
MVAERNSLVERIRAEELRVAKMEKLASLGRLTAGIAHEFRNPLNIISTSAQTMLRNPENLDLHRETGQYILEETERLSRTVDEFLQFAKPHTPVWERCSISEVIERVLQSLQGASRLRGVAMTREVDPSVSDIVTSPQHIERVLLNLGLNAIEAMPGGGVLTFGVLPGGAQAILITVRDTGPGIPAEHHARLFDPFFTTKPNGTGLGLAIVYMLVQGVKGTITFTTTSAGTAFILELPIDGSQL